MALVDLWVGSREQLEDKHIQQIIAFAGSGKLRDGEVASSELRQFLASVPSEFLVRYVNECLTGRFEGSGLALQDLINEIGRRLDFTVTFGRYRGTPGQIGFDGLWRSADDHTIIIEAKTTDAYRIDLNTVAGYRRALIQAGRMKEDNSSILMVVGREDTGDLEAQIRGSRHGWDIRLISVDALLHLMRLKENLEDPLIVRKIRNILTPQEFTKVDGIVDIVFATTEDVRQADDVTDAKPAEPLKASEYARFNDACVERIQNHLQRSLVKHSRTVYVAPDDSAAVVCAVSREYEDTGSKRYYWYAFHPHQAEALETRAEPYVGFGCGAPETTLLIPYDVFRPLLAGMNQTQKKNGKSYWHIHISREQDKFILDRKKGHDSIDVSQYIVGGGKNG